jgi:hypothetical protein
VAPTYTGFGHKRRHPGPRAAPASMAGKADQVCDWATLRPRPSEPAMH